MASRPHRSATRLLSAATRSGASYLRYTFREHLRLHVAVACVILAVEALALLFRVPGLGWWGRLGIVYGVVCVLGVMVFLAELRSMRAAIVFARREREARRHMGFSDDC